MLCVESGFISTARPVFQGHAGQRLMIVGQAPGPPSGQRRVPYTGVTGRALQGWLERAGFPPGSLHRDFYLTSLTKCFPGPATDRGGKGDRPPSAAEIAFCARRLGRLDVLAANAGIADVQPFPEIDEASWRRIIDVNLTGTFFCMQEAARVMIPAGGGAIVATASTNAFWVERGNSWWRCFGRPGSCWGGRRRED